jgi:predicted phosphate transport protein (TIGR00153 family)
MFDKLAAYSIDASKYLEEIVGRGCIKEEDIIKVKEIEVAADKVTYEIFEKLNKTFITPLDREDIHSLAHELDSIIDMVLKLSNLMKIYNVNGMDKKFIEVLKLVDSAIYSISIAVKGLRNNKAFKSVKEHYIEVDRLESLGDQLRNEAIAELFSGNYEAIYIMKWKDIFQTAEKLLDQCDDVAKVIETIIVKQA